MNFLPRPSFAYPQRTASWYAGHMAKSLRQIGELLDDIDLVIEARDARLPLTSINRAFDDLLGQVWGPRWEDKDGDVVGMVDRKGKLREKVVVYTKRDLAEEKYEQPLIKAFKDKLDQRVVFVDNREDKDVRELLRIAVNAAKANRSSMLDMRVLVVGMPNVGKSSLLNALRRVGVKRGKHFTTGAMPGVTRKLAGVVKIHRDPTVYVYDTPGVMVPFLGHGELGAERGIKFALTAGIKEDLFEPEIAVDYLLWRMNQRLVAERDLPPEQRSPSYVEALPLPPSFTEPTEDLATLLDPLCAKIGALQKGGIPDYNQGYAFIQKWFRDGKLGRWTFDHLAPTGCTGEELDWKVWQSVSEYMALMEAQQAEAARGEGLSGAQMKKREKAEREEKRAARYRRLREEKAASMDRLNKIASAKQSGRR
ncbi:P-loop containing nucleoside triphosphate hydrolase protein [Papiliotrema laurentii]|uniref:P-loop containing nucleoside triphosphate hydrolase protein n=1 Tax=Papiliotrema laurentii TaxID=5418 RepID=A0AAD9L7B0_PAPLA|nr:P-loop containing nucleoside triphosphate hydrolase protein [Papiliotrema laurentii]